VSKESQRAHSEPHESAPYRTGLDCLSARSGDFVYRLLTDESASGLCFCQVAAARDAEAVARAKLEQTHMDAARAQRTAQPAQQVGGESGPGGLTREVETPMPSNSPHDIESGPGGLTREVERPQPSHHLRCDQVVPQQFEPYQAKAGWVC
jgi:hypothetical protein